MKKTVLISVAMLAVVVFACVGIYFIKQNRVDLSFAENGETFFEYNDTHHSHSLSDKDLETLKELFNDKRMYKDTPSCGFCDEVSIVFNNSQTFCIAGDTCPIIYWKQKNMYFKLSEDEKTQLYKLLEAYGFSFPCV